MAQTRTPTSVVIELLDRSLVFVTGKGGVGKTTFSAALASLAAGNGKTVLVCEVDAKGDLASAFETEPTEFVEREVLPNLWAMSMDTEASLREYLKLNLHIPVVGRIGPLARAFDFVATAAPGVREILTVGKLCYEVREKNYDIVIVDAPATGHVIGQLAAPQAINDLVKVGLVRSQTDWMLEILSDATRTGVVVVTTPEEMPVNETMELVQRVRQETTVELAAVVVNRMLPDLFGPDQQGVFEELTRPEVVAELSRVLGSDTTPVIDAARLAVTLRMIRSGHLERLRAGLDRSVPMHFLPYLFARTYGLRTTRQLAKILGQELEREAAQ